MSTSQRFCVRFVAHLSVLKYTQMCNKAIVLVVTLCMNVLTSKKQYGWHIIYFSLWSRHIDSHKLQLLKYRPIGCVKVGVGMCRCLQFRHARSCSSVVTLAFRSSLFLVIGLLLFHQIYWHLSHLGNETLRFEQNYLFERQCFAYLVTLCTMYINFKFLKANVSWCIWARPNAS